jgi:hypothetical protein
MAHGAWRMFDVSTSPSVTSDPVVRSRGPTLGRCNLLISHYRCACDPAADPAASGSAPPGCRPRAGSRHAWLRLPSAPAGNCRSSATRLVSPSARNRTSSPSACTSTLSTSTLMIRVRACSAGNSSAHKLPKSASRTIGRWRGLHRGIAAGGPRGRGWVVGHAVQTLHRGNEHWTRSLLKRTPPGPTPGVHTLPGDPVARCMKELQVGAVASVLLPWRRAASARKTLTY